MKKQIKEIKVKNNKKINDLETKLNNRKEIDKILNNWGYDKEKDSKLVIISYENSKLYKLFFGNYVFINSQEAFQNINNLLSEYEERFMIVINKAQLNTKKLLKIESLIKSSNQYTFFASSPQMFVKKILKYKGENI